MNGLLERPFSKRSASPAAELDLNTISGGVGGGIGTTITGPRMGSMLPTLCLDRLPPMPGSGGGGGGGGSLRVAVAQVRLLERRTSSRNNSRPGTPTSNASTDTPTPSETNEADGEEEEEMMMLDAEEEAQGSETDAGGAQHRLKRPFELLIAAAMEHNPTQFQLPHELTCTTALPGG